MHGDELTPTRLPGSTQRLEAGGAERFQVQVHGIPRDAFVVRVGGMLRAYLNTCRHLSRPLDMGDGRFLEDDGATLVCRHHGARYDADTGRCIDGPCAGASLTSLVLETRPDGIWCVGIAR